MNLGGLGRGYLWHKKNVRLDGPSFHWWGDSGMVKDIKVVILEFPNNVIPQSNTKFISHCTFLNGK